MPGLLSVNRYLRRHRRAAAMLGVLIVLGVAALDAHAALPEHHDHHGVATVCIAALAIATLLAFGWRVSCRALHARRWRMVRPLRATMAPAATLPRVMARAGPQGCIPIRC